MSGARDPFNAFLPGRQVPVRNAEKGPLSGTRLAVKDIFDIAGQKTGGGNPERLAEAKPALRTAPAILAFLDAGARFAGRTQTDELTFSLMGVNAHYPQPVNPAAPDRVTGGSSSGSAAAVAGGLVELAAGSDTGGSIRAPASFCGLIGLRTTHGRVALEGAMPLAPSMDTFGWFADDIETYEVAGRVVLGRDSHRPKLTRALGLPVLDRLVSGGRGMIEYDRMREGVGPIERVSEWPLTSDVDELYWCFRRLQAKEAWATHGPWIEAKDRGLGPGIGERFGFGRTIDEATARVETVRRLTVRAELAQTLGADGYLVMPTVPGPAPKRDASQETLQAYREKALRLLCLSGLTGFPQITIPLGRLEGAPFGLSLLGPPGSDIQLIRLARTLMKDGP
ncbi:MAG: amidase [Rhizobiaceae bacterium]